MIIKKITFGFVVQTFDTELSKPQLYSMGSIGRCISQEFVAGDQVEYEGLDGSVIEGDAFDPMTLSYHPFNMEQPEA